MSLPVRVTVTARVEAVTPEAINKQTSKQGDQEHSDDRATKSEGG